MSTVTFQCPCEGEKTKGHQDKKANDDVEILVNLEDGVCCDGESLVSSPGSVTT